MLPDDPRHGSYAGAKAHRKADVPLCEPCRRARNKYLLERKHLHVPRSTRVADRLEDIRWMNETGESASGAAMRLGISLDALEKWCYRHALTEWRQMRAKETELFPERWSAA